MAGIWQQVEHKGWGTKNSLTVVMRAGSSPLTQISQQILKVDAQDVEMLTIILTSSFMTFDWLGKETLRG
jgi:hypothetical protein